MLTVSARDGTGLGDLWQQIEQHRRLLSASGELDDRRRQQRLQWMRSLVEEEVLDAFHRSPRVAEALPELERQVVAGEITPTLAAVKVLDLERAR